MILLIYSRATAVPDNRILISIILFYRHMYIPCGGRSSMFTSGKEDRRAFIPRFKSSIVSLNRSPSLPPIRRSACSILTLVMKFSTSLPVFGNKSVLFLNSSMILFSLGSNSQSINAHSRLNISNKILGLVGSNTMDPRKSAT